MTLIKGIIINDKHHSTEHIKKKKKPQHFSPNKTHGDQELGIKNAPNSPPVHEAS